MPEWLTDALFRCTPVFVQGFEIEVLEAIAAVLNLSLHISESPLKFMICAGQRLFRVYIQVPGQVDHGEQYVAELLLYIRYLPRANVISSRI